MNAQPLIRCINHHEKTKPFWMFRQAGRYLPEYRDLRKKEPNFLQFCYTPEYCVKAVIQPVERFDLDIAIVFSDILVIPDALGQNVWFEGGIGPKLSPLNCGDLIGNLRKNQLYDRLKPIYEGISGMVEALGQRELIGFSGSPWTLACYMIEGQGSRDYFSARRAALDDPTFVDLMKLLEDTIISHLSYQIDSGVKVIQLFDSWSGILSPDLFEQCVVKPTKRIVSALKKQYPQVPIMGFARGCGDKMTYYAENTGIDVLTIDETIQRCTFQQKTKYIVQGNLDPVYLLGSKEVLFYEVQKWKAETKDQAWIYNLGHGVHKDTKPEMVQYLVDCLRER